MDDGHCGGCSKGVWGGGLGLGLGRGDGEGCGESMGR